MNLAALWSLPVVFLVENNLYGMGTSIERHSAITELSRKAEGYGVPGERVDGMDVLAVKECVAAHLKTAREDRKPTLIEAFTYRFRGHSAADPEVYREKSEVEEWQGKDPIEAFAARCVGEGKLTDADVEAVRQEADEIVVAAVEFADASPEPPLESLYDHLYVGSETLPGWYAVDERTPDSHPGEEERDASQRARELAEKGAAYGGKEQVQPAVIQDDEDEPTEGPW
jgi:pyruvate dehydrogenase E1 component alpha subunit